MGDICHWDLEWGQRRTVADSSLGGEAEPGEGQSEASQDSRAEQARALAGTQLRQPGRPLLGTLQ